MFSRILAREEGMQLDTLMDIDKEIELFRTHGLKLLKHQVLYKKGKFTERTSFYGHERKESISCLKSQHAVLNLTDKESEEKILAANLGLTHLGLIVVGIKRK